MNRWSNVSTYMPPRQIFRRSIASLLILVTLVLAGRSQAQVHNGVQLVKAELLADTTAITPGKPFMVGLRLKMAPHWHTYWLYSGDAGIPTKLDWQLPAGFKAGSIQWPVPIKIESPGDIINYGYNDEVMLLTEITPPAQLPAGEVTLNGKASWLVCEQICIPGDAALALKLPVGNHPQAANPEVFARYRALLPKPIGADAKFTLEKSVEGNDLIVTLKGGPGTFDRPGEFYPLPDDALTLGHPGNAVLATDGSSTRTKVPVVDGPKDPGKLAGVYVFRSGVTEGDAVPYDGRGDGGVSAKNSAVPAAGSTVGGGAGKPAGPTLAGPGGSLGYFLLLGFLGGLILNVMPCVLPVISLKLFSFVKQSNEAPERVLKLGLAYAAGVFTWFMGFAALVVALKAAGREVGYALQFQNPWFIVGLSAVTFVFALNLLGVFEIVLPGAVSNAAGAASGKGDGLTGAFVQGVLVTVLGSACTTAFVGPALGFAFSQSALVIFTMFAAIAAGMSAPFVLIAANPHWLRFLPKPGAWMERVKQGTGFVLLATVLWLLSVLGHMRGSDAVVWSGVLLLVLGVACWVQGTFNTLVASEGSRWLSRAFITVAIVGGGWFCIGQIEAARLPAAADQRTFAAQLDAALKTGQPVFVDFTADWCVNCKVNERAVLNSDPVQKALRDRNAVLLKADWTTGAEDITKLLRQFGRAGVPLYVLYPAGKPEAPVVMPELLTQQIVLDAFTEADRRAGTAKPIAAR